MSASNAPFGLRPAYHPSGLDRAKALANGIVSAYSSDILKGAPVKMATTGVLQVIASTEAWLGAFDGVEFTDSTGRRRVSNYWPASTVATAVVAYYYDDPQIVYEIQADGVVAQTAIGDNANFSNLTAGSNVTGLSQCTISSSLSGSSAYAQMRILDIAPYPGNAWGDAYPILRVSNSLSQFVAPINAI